MFYYRIKEIEVDGEFFFRYFENKKKFSKEEFSSHMEEALMEWVKNQPNKLQLVTSGSERDFRDAAYEIYSILKEKYGYRAINVELTIEYYTWQTTFDEEADKWGSFDALKSQSFDMNDIYEEGFVNLKKEYHYLDTRKLRKRGKDSLKDKPFYLYRLKEVDGPIYFYLITHKERFSKEVFREHLESVRKELIKEKGIKPIIGIDLANKMCEKFGYHPINVEASVIWDIDSHYIKTGKNRFGFVVESTGTVDFENEYPYRRDKDEDYLIEGDRNDFLRYFSESLSKEENPRLLQINGIWYAYNEWRDGNYASKIDRDDVKLIANQKEYHKSVINYCEPTDKKYPQRKKEAIKNSIELSDAIILN